MDKETNQLLQERAKARSLSESGYVRMLILQDAGLMLNTGRSFRRAKKTIKDLYRDMFKTGRYDDFNMENYDEKKLLHAIYGLEERQRQFVLERYSESLTLDQIGKRNGLGKESVRRVIVRAMRILKRRMEILAPKK